MNRSKRLNSMRFHMKIQWPELCPRSVADRENPRCNCPSEQRPKAERRSIESHESVKFKVGVCFLRCLRGASNVGGLLSWRFGNEEDRVCPRLRDEVRFEAAMARVNGE